MDMGRPKTTFADLPARMTGRKLKSKILYYYTGNGRKEPLGDDLRIALHKYADLDTGTVATITFMQASDLWELGTDPKLPAPIEIGRRGKRRAPGSIKTYKYALVALRKYFGHNKLDSIEPQHIQQYLLKRTKRGVANSEVGVFSLIWNWARATGKTSLANPTTGIETNYLPPRERYVNNEEYLAVYEKAPFWVQDALDLLLLTYQRPGDVLKARVSDIQDGNLWFKQQKTGKRLGFELVGELAEAVQRARSRPRTIGSLYLVADHDGQQVSLRRLRTAFYTARGTADWQLRDLRAKAITDTVDIREASERAAHHDIAFTKRVYDRTRGRRVKPLR